MPNTQQLPESFWSRVRHAILGPARNVYDPSLGHHISLVPLLAWIGLGADGMSSSAYGPDEAFRALGAHTYLAPFLVLATALTIFIIALSYSKIIEHFPQGGGGYLVATKLLGNAAGVTSGAALLVDYVLTITVSISAGGDAIFSLLPLDWQPYKILVEFATIFVLMITNLRGVKESVKMLIPIFVLFLVTHAVLIGGSLFFHLGDVGGVVGDTRQRFQEGVSSLGAWGLFLVFIRAYSMGGGTYTGIEGVSNGMGVLRDPKVETGKKTMIYMGVSLAVTAGGLLLSYMLLRIQPVYGQTLNATLSTTLFGDFTLGGLPVGHWFVWSTMFAAALLLLVAAQTGFIDGPPVMANLASDLWLPRRFATLSDRLTIQRGVILMGVAALATLAYTRGDVRMLVVMYSINVFVTFSLSQLGMCRFWIQRMKGNLRSPWLRNLFLHGVGFILCAGILLVMVIEKFTEGGWVTVAVTLALILLCKVIRKHYRNVAALVLEIGETFEGIPMVPSGKQDKGARVPKVDPTKPTAVILVGGGHSRMGIHTLFTIFRLFPHTFHNVVFLSIGVINSEFFKADHGVKEMEERVMESLKYYVDLAHGLGIPAEAAFRVGTDVVSEAADLCIELSRQYSGAVFFGSELVFQEPKWYHRILHNETAYAIQRRLRFAGLSVVILPILLFEKPEKREEEMSEIMVYRGVKRH
ncbi:MAG TPA: APC family permease [bacterium]|nr:APC family permease [bacterium]